MRSCEVQEQLSCVSLGEVVLLCSRVVCRVAPFVSLFVSLSLWTLTKFREDTVISAARSRVKFSTRHKRKTVLKN